MSNPPINYATTTDYSKVWEWIQTNARLIAAAPEMLDAIRAHCKECAYFKATDAARCRECKFKKILRKSEQI